MIDLTGQLTGFLMATAGNTKFLGWHKVTRVSLLGTYIDHVTLILYVESDQESCVC